jgi:hypothetical protein
MLWVSGGSAASGPAVRDSAKVREVQSGEARRRRRQAAPPAPRRAAVATRIGAQKPHAVCGTRSRQVSVELGEHPASIAGPEGATDPGPLEVDGQDSRRITPVEEEVVRREVLLQQARVVEPPGQLTERGRPAGAFGARDPGPGPQLHEIARAVEHWNQEVAAGQAAARARFASREGQRGLDSPRLQRFRNGQLAAGLAAAQSPNPADAALVAIDLEQVVRRLALDGEPIQLLPAAALQIDGAGLELVQRPLDDWSSPGGRNPRPQPPADFSDFTGLTA